MSDTSNTVTDQPNNLLELRQNYKSWISLAIFVIPVTLILVIAFSDLSEATNNQLVSLLIFSSLLILDSYRRFMSNLAGNSPVTLVDKGQYSTTYIYGDSVVNQQTVNREKQSLADAAREIQQLLQEISSDYSESETIVSPSSAPRTAKETTENGSSQLANVFVSESESETVHKVELATKVIERVESDSSLKQRAIEAAKQGALEALKSTAVGLIVTAAIEGWLVDD